MIQTNFLYYIIRMSNVAELDDAELDDAELEAKWDQEATEADKAAIAAELAALDDDDAEEKHQTPEEEAAAFAELEKQAGIEGPEFFTFGRKVTAEASAQKQAEKEEQARQKEIKRLTKNIAKTRKAVGELLERVEKAKAKDKAPRVVSLTIKLETARELASLAEAQLADFMRTNEGAGGRGGYKRTRRYRHKKRKTRRRRVTKPKRKTRYKRRRKTSRRKPIRRKTRRSQRKKRHITRRKRTVKH